MWSQIVGFLLDNCLGENFNVFFSFSSDLKSKREPKWIGEGAEYCKNPKSIMEKAKIHLTEIIERVKIGYFHTTIDMIYPTNQSFWKFSDDKELGSCHTFVIPKSHERKQIQKFEFVMKSSVYWKINSPGDINLRGGKYHYNISDRSNQKHNINYEVYHMLNYANDQPCVDDSYYEKDSCSDDLIFKESMEEVNCTWPFVKNKNHICTDKDSAIEAMEIGIDERRRPKCPNPCNYIKVITIPISKNRNVNFLKFFLPDSIKVHKAYYAYDEVSLIAEIGGYVGLFLGSSVYQITDLLDWLIDSWKRHQA